ncbi:glycoside hydrolase/deacetylase [Dendrothele bispora CBS 962.96]|uniref:Glycoside hydrolase/deacetylase n=1 Tax=Dendrothele bispora (strain CBS 962.96) TaxID=1314807 RepID=A0A4S8MYA0_DENBC|nr:glycoside hydrolase/deacetylase [Dendrothele bispora CBS 962.96]
MIALSTLILAFALSATAHPHSQSRSAHSHFYSRATTTPVTQCNHGFSMTYDDGPYIHTTNVSTNLASLGAKGTFYMNGNNWGCIYDAENVAHVQNAYANGHQIASHTWSHPDIAKLTNDQLDIEIMRLDQAFIKILGIKPNIFRPPYGSITADQVSYITTKHKKTVVTWELDSEDTQGANTNSAVLAFYSNLAQQAKSSNKMPRDPHFTLAHDVQPQTGTSSLEAGQILLDASYSLVTTAQCLDLEPYTYIGAPQTRDSTWTCSGTWSVSQYSEGTSSSSSTSTSTTSTGTSTTSTSTSTTSTSTSTTSTSTTGTTGTSTTSGTSTSTSATSSSTACSKTYTVKSGDYCWLIATNNGLTVDQLQAANPSLNCDTLQVGQVLNLCTSTSTSATSTATSSGSSSGTASTTSSTSSGSSSGTASTTSSTSSGSSSGTASTTSSTTSSSATSTACSKNYTVKSGDYCWLVANNNGLTVDQLQAANPGLNCDALQVGQVLNLCTSTTSASTTAATTTRATTSSTSATTTTTSSTSRASTSSTSATTTTTSSTSRASTSSTSATSTTTSSTSTQTTTSRSTTSSTATSTTASSTSSSCPKSYTVKSGDYCYSIATSNGLTTAQLQTANPSVNCSQLQIGQKLSIPCTSSPTTTKASSATSTSKSSTSSTTSASRRS